MQDTPIYNKETEEATVAGMIVQRECIDDLANWLRPDDFYSQDFAEIYKAILHLRANGTPVDLLTLFDEFMRIGKPELSAKCAGLVGLQNDLGYSATLYYAKIVKEQAARRNTMDIMAETTKDIYSLENDINEVLEKHDTAMMGLRKRATGGNGATVTNELFADIIIKELEDAHKNKDNPKIEFLWNDLADLTGPLNGGSLVGIIAEPGVGKTVFLENCAEYWLKQGWNVAFYHHELSTGMMGKRYIQRQTGISVKAQSKGELSSDDWGRILKATNEMTQWPGNLFYEHCPGWTAGEIASHLTHLNDMHGIDIVIIDYFNKISHTERPGLNAALSREQDIETIKIALEINDIVGLMAAQFDKASRQSGGNKSLADAKETSALEDKSNVGIVIRRDKDSDGNRPPETTFCVVKCNAGREGVAHVYFKGDRYTFFPATGSVNLNE